MKVVGEIEIMDKTEDKTLEQVRKVPNPTGKGGLGDHPENINYGGRPKNQESFAYWMNYFKNLPTKEFIDWPKNNPEDVRTVAADLSYMRVFNARKDLAEFKEVADRTEGKARQLVELDGKLETTSNEQIATMIQAALLKDDQSEENTDNQDTDK